MKKYILVLSFFISFASSGQNIKLPAETDIPDLRLAGSASYSVQDLVKYAGSNTDLILEYGFRTLDVYDYSSQNENVRLEIYTMEDAPSAFGIYSVSVSHCLFWNRWSTFSCTNQNQIAAASGTFFFNIRDMKKTGGGQSLCEQILQQIITNNPQDRWYMPPLFQSQKLARFTNSLKYMEGPKGVAIGAPQMIDLLDELQYSCFSIDVSSAGRPGILVRIQFADFNAMDRFLSNAGLNNSQDTGPIMGMSGMYRSKYKIDDTKLIYLECANPDMKLTDLIPDRPDLYGGW